MCPPKLKSNKMISKKVSRICKDCGEEIFANRNMVMVKYYLWKKICDKIEDDICDDCMEKRLGRKITKDDFKPSPLKGEKIIPCNKYWLKYKKEISRQSKK